MERCAAITHVLADGADWIPLWCWNVRTRSGALTPSRGVPATGTPDEFAGRRETSPCGDPTACRAGHRARQGAEGRPVRAVEGNPENHHPTTSEARVDRQDRPPPAPGLPPQGRPSRLVFQLPASEAPAALDKWIGWACRCRILLRGTATPDRQAQGLHPRRDRARPVQRAHRIGEHQDPAHHLHGLRLPLTRSPHRLAMLHPRRPPPHPSPAGNDPRISQKSQLWSRHRRCGPSPARSRCEAAGCSHA